MSAEKRIAGLVVQALTMELQNAVRMQGVPHPAQPPQYAGNSKILNFPAGGIGSAPSGALPLAIQNPQVVSESLFEWHGPPGSYVISMSGLIQSASLGVTSVLPFTVFKVQWSIGATQFTTFVDGHSDHFLTVFAEQVQVFVETDQFNLGQNAQLLALGVPQYRLPFTIAMQAAISPSAGEQTNARRTLMILPKLDTQDFDVPYAARGFRISSAEADFYTPPSFVKCNFFTGNQVYGTPVEGYTGANLVTAHDAGVYLNVPSQGDVLRLLYNAPAPVGAAAGFVEYLLQP